MINIKNQEEIHLMQQGGKILGRLLDKDINEIIKTGVNASEINNFCEKYIKDNRAVPILKGFVVGNLKFPYSICFSMNDEVVHGFPSHNKVIKDGDIFTIDISIKWKNYFLDAARTYYVGNISKEMNNFIVDIKNSLDVGISNAKVGNRIGNISNSIQDFVESRGYSIVQEFCGHGIGKELHEYPMVPNFGKKHLGCKIVEGMTLAIEPIINLGKHEIYIKEDKWTAKTKDGSISCHFEDTIAVGKNGPVILTRI